MFESSTIMKSNYLLKKAMDTSLLRHQVISDNIANADTPYFKRSTVTFESQLERALNSEETVKNSPQAFLTEKKHISFNKAMDYHEVKPKIFVDYDTNYRNDKNNVDIEKEVSDAVVNTMRYKALTEKLKLNYRMLNMAMSS